MKQIKKQWEELKIANKFTLVLVLLISILLISLGRITYLSRQSSLYELTFNRMNSQADNLILLLEIKHQLSDSPLSSNGNSISYLESKFQRIRYYENGFPFLMDRNGNYLIHPIEKGNNIAATQLFSELTRNRNGQIFNQGADRNLMIFYRYYQPQDVYVGAVISANEVIQKPLNELAWVILAGIIAGILLLIFVIRFMMTFISKPIEETSIILEKMSRGVNLQQFTSNRKDELGRIYSIINNLITGLRNTAEFAIEIGKKNFDFPFTPMSSEDSLGNALLNMRESLKKAAEDEKLRKVEDEKRRWTNEGLAKFGEILRLNNDNMEVLSYNIIKNLVKYLNINQGGIFIVEEETDSQKYLNMTACYAYDRQKYLTKKIELGEGITGTCFLEGQTIYIKEIPEDYITITSGLGDAPPGFLLVVPLRLNEEIHGVVELASFNPFQSHEIEFVEKIGESIASTISGVKINIQTAQLLQQSQHQSEIMRAQEEEMRQNMEEMQSTQEEMQRRNEEMKKIQENLNKETALLISLLNTTEDLIYFKDKDSKFLRVSASMLKNLGLSKQEEIIGKSDFDFASREIAQPKFDAEQEIIRNGKSLKVDERDIGTEGERWVSTMKMPLRDESGKIVGTFGVSRDITVIKHAVIRAEELQKELELQRATITRIINEIPHKIYLKDQDLKFVLVNQAVANVYKGKSIEDLIGTNDFDHYDNELATQYANSDKDVLKNGEKTHDQIDVVEGKSYLLRTRKMPFYIDYLGQTGLLGIQTDITEMTRLIEIEKEHKKLQEEQKKKNSKPV